MKKLLRYLLPAFLLAVLIIPLMPATPVLAITVVERSIAAGADDCLRKLATAPEFVVDKIWNEIGAGSSASKQHGAGLRFTNINIDKEATIHSAKLTFYDVAGYDTPGTCSGYISAEDIDDAGDFSGDDGASFDARFANHTTARIDWAVVPAWDGSHIARDSIDFTAVIQEIVDRAGWVSGNDIVIFWEDFDGRSLAEAGGHYRLADSFETVDGVPVKLTIEHSPEPPTATTGDATNKEDTTATLNGNLTSLGDFTPVYVDFQYGLDVGYGSDTTDQEKTETGAINANISGLTPEETYHFRIRVKYDTLYVYGDDNTFETTASETGSQWLTGYDYRRQITVTGSTAGVQTNYQKELTVYKDTEVRPPTQFEFLERFDDVIPQGALGHAQGVASDGTYLYATNVKTLYRMSKIGTVLATHSNAHLAGTDMAQVNGVFIKDNYIYLGSMNHPTTPKRGYIKVFNKADLSYVTEHRVKDQWTEGCTYYNGSWWVVYYGWKYVSRYNDSWVWQADYSLEIPDLVYVQGCFSDGNYLYVCLYGPGVEGGAYGVSGTAVAYTFDTPTFSLVKQLDVPETITMQDGDIEPGADEGWWVDPGVVDGHIIHTNIDYGVNLSGHCEDDFGDIRFTTAVGNVELDYWVEEYTEGESVTFWIELDTLAVSPTPTTFYIYYGKSGQATSSNIDNTMDHVNDFNTGTIEDFTNLYVGGPDTYEASVTQKHEGTHSLKLVEDTGSGGVYTNDKTFWSTSLKQVSFWVYVDEGTSYSQVYWNTAGDNVVKVFIMVDSTGIYHSSSVGGLLKLKSGNYLDQWLKINLILNSSTQEYHINVFDSDYDLIASQHNGDMQSTTSSARDVLFYIPASTTSYNDLVYSHKYADTEPYWGTWASEEGEVPVVTTKTATDIAITTATLEGSLDDLADYTPVYVSFDYGLTDAYGSTTDDQSKTAPCDFSAGIDTLNADTDYHYRARVKYDTDKWRYGLDMILHTQEAGTPLISTGDAIEKTTTSATLQGTITDLGGEATVYVSFLWGETTEYLGGPTGDQTKTAIGSFDAPISGLSPSTTYHYKARLRYNGSYVYGSDKTFVTSAPGAPTVTTNNAASISSTQATLQGTLNSLGSYSPVYVFFEYGLTIDYGAIGSPTTEKTMTAAGGFNEILTGLEPGTTYHFRARVRYNSIYVNGNDTTFATPTAGEPGIDPPDVLRIDDIKVFTNYLEGGDQIYVIAYRIIYNSGTPMLDITDYFDFQLFDGAVLKGQWPVKSWGYRPGSVYLCADSAPAWGGGYRVKIIGAPEQWETPPECYRDLTPGDWQGNVGDGQLDTWVISLAGSLQSYYDTEMVTYVTGGLPVLSDQGAIIFNMGIPGLNVVRPNLFSPTWTGWPSPELEEVDEISVDTEERMGSYVYGLFETCADFLDLDVKTLGALVFGALYLIVAIVIGVETKNGILGVGIATPVVIGGAWLGVVPMALLAIAAGIFAMYVIFTLWMKGV